MKNLYLVFFLLLLSCVYPDIDTVPDFKNIELTDQELLDLCNNKTSDRLTKFKTPPFLRPVRISWFKDSTKYNKELCKKINYNKYYRSFKKIN